MASGLVQHVADQWRQGVPLRLACKILRKQGIHAWSLLVWVEGDQRANLIQQLAPPRWLIEASRDSLLWERIAGMIFRRLPKGAHLPDGLVVPIFGLFESRFVRRLPDRIWVENFLIANCEALERLPACCSRPVEIDLSRCPRLKSIPEKAAPLHLLQIQECEALEDITLMASRRPFRDGVDLRDLPSLERIKVRGVVHILTVWNCPSLKSLGELTVDRELEVHRCQSLCVLPKFKGAIRGRVTDCLKMSETDLTEALPGEGSTLKIQPWRGAQRLPPIEPIPSSQTATITQLFPESAFQEVPAWPWPPVPPGSFDHSIERSLRALGLSSLERMRCQVQQGSTLSDITRGRLSLTCDPCQALLLLRGWMGEAFAMADEQAIDVLMDQAARFGFSLVSLWLALFHDQQEALLPRLPPWWRVRLAGTSYLEEVSETLDGIPGPLVIANRMAVYPGHRLGPKAIEGPLFMGGDLTIDDWSELECLPDLMVVKGDLKITACPALRHFPRRLEVVGGLYIDGLPRLERRVCRVAVGGGITVVNAPALRLVPLGSWEQ